MVSLYLEYHALAWYNNSSARPGVFLETCIWFAINVEEINNNLTMFCKPATLIPNDPPKENLTFGGNYKGIQTTFTFSHILYTIMRKKKFIDLNIFKNIITNLKILNNLGWYIFRSWTSQYMSTWSNKSIKVLHKGLIYGLNCPSYQIFASSSQIELRMCILSNTKYVYACCKHTGMQSKYAHC